MSEWKAKRFWKEAQVTEDEGGYGVALDGRPLKTPAKAALTVPSAAIAAEIAAEWQAQDEQIDPTAMPYTRSANAAIDKVARQHGEVADLIAAYGDSDLTCYRADAPAELVARQAEAWDPLLEWLAASHGIALAPVTGVMHRPQDPAALAAISALVHALDPFELTAFHDLVGLTGSFVLGQAVADGHIAPEQAWTLSRIDEDWQAEQWGTDEEAAAMAAVKYAAFLHAAAFLVRHRG